VAVSGYKIWRCQGTTCTPSTQIATSSSNFYVDSGLSANTNYTYAVSAYDAAGNNSNKSNVATATTKTNGWLISADFEKGTLGQRAWGVSGFGWAGTNTLYSNELVNTGSKSAEMQWVKGTTGIEQTNGEITFSSNLTEGDEIWIRLYYYFKSPWSWSCSPVVKILRAQVKNSNGSHLGYLSVMSDSRGQILLSNELINEVNTEFPTGYYFDIDKWQCIEMYIKFSTTNPIFRIWKDGILIKEDTLHRTLTNSSDISNFLTLHYWNGGVTQDQIEFVDDLVLTTERPSKKDAQGNSMIGPVD